MWTVEGKRVNAECPREEYPTPQFRRDSYFCLNGSWDFSLDEDPKNHSDYPETILVPFAVETPLSGIHGKVNKGQIMHYRKKFTLPEGFVIGRVLLHFEAVDQVCDVYLNGVKIAHHEGGYLPFTVDCLELRPGMNELCVDVTDDTDSPIYPRGKQSSKPKGIWYTATSGIWGSVWMESVPMEVIQWIRITPLFDEKRVKIDVRFEGKFDSGVIEVFFNGRSISMNRLGPELTCTIPLIHDFHPWAPAHPFLYDLTIRVNKDIIHSYFAMRKFSIMEHKGHKVFALNNRPFFLSGVLDQGYYPDGGLTAPTDQAMIDDIQMMREMGFSMLRKHIKIECMRWYYHCDRLGMVVMQDFVNGGRAYKKRLIWGAPFFTFDIDDTLEKNHALLGRKDEEGRIYFENEMPEVIARLYNVPCIAVWTLFNEGWGQFDCARLTQKLRELDPTRPIDSTSGWFDRGEGDFYSRHIYFRKVKMTNDGKRAMALTEFGAYSCIVPGHCDYTKKTAYKYFKTPEALTDAIIGMYQNEIIPLIPEGLSLTVLTQLSDVESETNGLLTYDRKVSKMDAKKMKAINDRLIFEVRAND